MRTATRRENGPPTSCHQCGEGPINGFDVVDTDHGIHRVLCTDCAICFTDEELCVDCKTYRPRVDGTSGADGWACSDCSADRKLARNPRINEMPLSALLSAVADALDQAGGGHGLYFAKPQEGEISAQERLRTEAAFLLSVERETPAIYLPSPVKRIQTPPTLAVVEDEKDEEVTDG